MLGGFTLADGETHVELPKTLQRLVAFIGLRHRTTRADTVGGLWPEVREDKALGSLRTALWRLQQCGPRIVVAQGETLALDTRVQVDVDALVHAARLVLTDDNSASDAALLAHGCGELLPGWLDEWVLVERERLRQCALHGLENLAAHHLRTGRYADALDAALRALRADPLRETPHRLLIQVHIAEGNHSEVLSAYHAYRTLLHRELGVAPSPALQMLVREAVRPVAPAGPGRHMRPQLRL
ncbi:BTAD domain-containing putative transcriptional regulator [Streptomyces sp. NPDC001339]|uniref:AfsR/SARP family transcriptional regulator n=1 Tax=Streptomyces sp. NPDC001339 TaxID=3364563 RepID=UPI003689DF2B